MNENDDYSRKCRRHTRKKEIRVLLSVKLFICNIYAPNNSMQQNKFIQGLNEALLRPATHLAILYADRGEIDCQIFATDWCGHT